MSHKQIITKYKKLLTKHSEELKKIKHTLKWIMVFRLFLFTLTVYFLILAVKNSNIIYGSISFISFIIFLFAIKYALKLNFRKGIILELIKIDNNELSALQHNFTPFDGGVSLQDDHHPFTYDLDLFGEGSLFQQINRTVSSIGKMMLGEWMKFPLTEPNLIQKRQMAIDELKEHLDYLHKFRAYGGYANHDTLKNRQNILYWVQENLSAKRYSFYKNIAIIFTFISICVLILSFLNVVPSRLIFLLFIINGTILFSKIKQINREHSLIGKRYELIRQYASKFKIIEEIDFKGDLLKEIRNKIIDSEYSAGKALKSLASIINVFDYRLNMIVSIILNGFFFWDFFSMIRLYRWKKKYGPYFVEWFQALDQFDALQSISNYHYNNPDFVFATFETDINLLEVKDLGHPQIDPAKRILNDLSIKNRGEFMIITGPNMAGKSTFLRTVGTSIILAQCGAPVCATYFNLTPLILYTSMRTSDSLHRNESYFYAELKRLKEILNAIEIHENIFIILDEILKGTNSTDKANGSKEFLKKIISLKATGIIATHDLSLGDTENEMPDLVKNYCFESKNENQMIIFDYLLKKGKTTRMNAMYLMKNMGII